MRKLITLLLTAVCAFPVLLTGGCGKAEADGGVQVKNDTRTAEIDTTDNGRIETATFALG